MNIKLFGLIYIIQLLLSIHKFVLCDNINIYSIFIFLLHHLIDVYAFFGFLVIETNQERKIHLLVISGVILHWLTNNYECILTTHLNEICSIDRKIYFPDIITLIRSISGFTYLHLYWLIILIIYDWNLITN